jgi:hypothetical protein
MANLINYMNLVRLPADFGGLVVPYRSAPAD